MSIIEVPGSSFKESLQLSNDHFLSESFVEHTGVKEYIIEDFLAVSRDFDARKDYQRDKAIQTEYSYEEEKSSFIRIGD